MKKVLFFLIGFLIPMMWGHISYAGIDCVDSMSAFVYNLGHPYGPYRECVIFGPYANREDAQAAVVNQRADWPPTESRPLGCFEGMPIDGSYQYYPYYGETCNSVTEDGDGDGIEDGSDYYPEDGEPHMVRRLGFWTADGSMFTEVVAEYWETDKGDRYYTGTIPTESEADDMYNTYGGPWQVPGGVISDDDFPEPDEEQVFPGTSDGSVIPNSSSNTSQGQTSNESDTDSAGTKKIVDNTAAAAKNTSTIADYQKALNKSVAGMAKNQAAELVATNSNKDANAQRNAREIAAEAVAEEGSANFSSTDISEYYNSETFSSSLVVGTDYEEVEGLAEKEYITTFIEGNALKTAMDNSGFEMSNAVCEMTLDLGGMGSHTMSICEFDDGFTAAGNILFGLCSLAGLIMVVRG